jgi:hypothetical protein
MNWAEIMKATAIATSADRSAAADRVSVVLPWSWNPHDVWLERARKTTVSGLQNRRIAVSGLQNRQNLQNLQSR